MIQNKVQATIDMINSLDEEDALKVANNLPALIAKVNNDIIVERKVIGPAEAINILRENNSLNLQRNDKSQPIKYYTRLMKNNKWVPDSIITLAHLNNEVYLANGQNRLHAVASSQKKVPFLILHKEFKTADELAEFYTSLDHGSNRSAQDDWKALLATKNKKILDSKEIARLKGAISVLISGFNLVSARTRVRYSPIELLHIIKRFERAASAFYKIATPAKGDTNSLGRRLLGSSVVAVALLTLEKPSDTATNFWKGVSTGTGDEHSVTKRVYEFIKNNKIDAVNVGIFARVIANAWNIYFENPEYNMTTPLTTEGITQTDPVTIAGTEFDGTSKLVLTIDGKFVDSDTIPATKQSFPRPKKRKGVYVWDSMIAAYAAEKKPTAQDNKVQNAIEEKLEKITEEVIESDKELAVN